MLSLDGIIPVQPLQDTLGFMTRSAEDLANSIFAATKKNQFKPETLIQEISDDDLKGLRVGIAEYRVYKSYPIPGHPNVTYSVDPEILNLVNKAIGNFEKLRAMVRNITVEIPK